MTGLLSLVALLAMSPARAGEADALIDQVVAAYGGREALQAVERFEVQGDIVASARGLTGTFIRKVEADGDLATIMTYPSLSEGRLLVGGRGWRTKGDELEPVSGMLLEAIHLQGARLRLPLTLDAHREQATLGEPKEVDGVTYSVVSVTLGPSTRLTAWIDPETGLARASEGAMTVSGHAMTFTALYSDYRPVDGLMVAHTEQTFARGVPTATLEVRSVDWAPDSPELKDPGPDL